MGGIRNMKSLIIDTSTIQTICALFDDENEIFREHHIGATEHAEVLPKLVAAALKVAPVVDQVIVGMGPGPFTGLRVGITFAQVFATAREIPWIGICSLDAIEVPLSDYIVATDARRNEVYWAQYQSGERILGPAVGKSELVPAGNRIGFTFTESLFPEPRLLLAQSRTQNVREPIYLRRPDAIPTSERG
jgi:tRNA threonylcarbamoyl adenosine modification protein YeaZ